MYHMTQHWVLAIVFTVQAVLPIGGGACPCAAPPAATAPECSCGCDAADDSQCCCYEADRDPADHGKATLTNVEGTTPRLFVLTESLPQPTIVTDTAVALEPIITPRSFLICLTRAQRAPPA